MARKLKQLHPAQKRLILDYAGVAAVRSQPKKASELEQLYSLFKNTEEERFQAAYDVIINKITPSGDNNAVVAAKVSEIVESNLKFQESQSVNEITKAFMDQTEKTAKDAIEIVQREVEKYKKDFITHQVKIGTKKAKKIKGMVCEQFPDLLQLASARINIMMIGPAGCGKTHIAGQLAESLELDFASQSCSAGMSESQLTGWLLPLKGGNFEYVASEFIRIYENGGVFLLDEMDAADPNVLIFINQALANTQFSLPQRHKKPVVKRHKDFVAVAACNTFGGGADAMYHARNALDASTIDRFKMGMVAIDYSEKVERNLVDEDILEWGTEIRESIQKHGMRKIMSTRVLRDATTMMGVGWDLDRIATSYFLDWSPEEIAIIEKDCDHPTKPSKAMKRKVVSAEVDGKWPEGPSDEALRVMDGKFQEELLSDSQKAKRRREERMRNQWRA